jgi:hypothetical protein
VTRTTAKVTGRPQLQIAMFQTGRVGPERRASDKALTLLIRSWRCCPASYSPDFSLERPSIINSRRRGEDGFPFSPPRHVILSPCVMLGTLSGDLRH